MTTNQDLSLEEIKAIKALKRIAKNWPGTLWLYSAAGTLWVMRKNDNGKYAIGGENPSQEGFDPDSAVDKINIENEGGDW